eukprot:4844075-Pyramimonas_sp.AAC.3
MMAGGGGSSYLSSEACDAVLAPAPVSGGLLLFYSACAWLLTLFMFKLVEKSITRHHGVKSFS